jgi:hypothetical protein
MVMMYRRNLVMSCLEWGRVLTCYSVVQYGRDILVPSPLVKMAAQWLYTVPSCGAGRGA